MSDKNKAKEYIYKEGVKNHGKEKTISAMKQAFAKKMGVKEKVEHYKAEWKKAGPFKSAADSIQNSNFNKIHKAIKGK